MAEGIAEVLAKNRIASSLDCTCGAVFHEVDSSDDVFPERYESDFEAHQAAVLAANGYGKLGPTQFVLAEREAELLKLKGPCRAPKCRLHFAHHGPCDTRRPE